MRNPFEDLFRQRRRHQRQLQLERNERERSELQHIDRIQARLQEKKRYDAMVTGLLTQFIRAANPALQFYSYNRGWSVGRWDRLDDNSLRWHSILDVQLVYEMNDTALFFEVIRHRKKVRAGLGENELAMALRRLYPPETSG